MRIEKCWFCSSNIYPGHGMMFVRNDCKTFRFCRSKCHKHFKAKHNPRKFKWTKAYRKLHGKEMTVDSTFDFEKRRHTPVRYDRDLWVKTIKAMKIVSRIKAVRKVRFARQRLAAQRKLRLSLAEKELHKGADLLATPLPHRDRADARLEILRKKSKEKEAGLKISHKSDKMDTSA